MSDVQWSALTDAQLVSVLDPMLVRDIRQAILNGELDQERFERVTGFTLADITPNPPRLLQAMFDTYDDYIVQLQNASGDELERLKGKVAATFRKRLNSD